MKRIFVTLDTEMDADIHWTKHYPPQYSSVIEGIPQFLRPIWDKCKVHPIYFVSPEILYSDECVKVLKQEINKGAIIGAHLHAEWIEPENMLGKRMDKVRAKFPCFGCDDEIEKKKLQNLTKMIQDKLGVRPEWYRAARYGADTATIKILSELGYKYDSSVTPNIDWSKKGGPNHREGSLHKYHISQKDIYKESNGESEDSGIIEMPITILKKRFGIFAKLLPENWLFYQWLRPSHMTYWELKKVIRYMEKEKIEEGVMMFHTMEIMINTTPYVRTKWMQRYFLWRLEKTLQ